jgi:hypothetical protein
MASTQASKEAIWYRSFFDQLGITRITSSPTTLYSDSQGSIALVKNPEYHSRTKHIDIRHHFVREHVFSGETIFEFVRTENMIADVLTKPLGKVKHQLMIQSMGIKSIMSGSVGSH